MTITAADFSDAARQAVLDGMDQRARTRGFWTPKLRDAARRPLRLCAPHRVALLSLNRMQLDSGNEPQSLRSRTHILGWRFLIINELDEPIAAAHTDLTADGTYRLGELNEGPYVGSTFEALQKPLVLEAMSRKKDGNPFEEVLLLLAPPIYFAGLWVRFQREDQDFILPLDRSHLPDFVEVEPRVLLSTLHEASAKVPRDSHSAG